MKKGGRKPVDHEARERVRTDLDTSFCVEAGAGTGKTSLLVDRYLSIIRSGFARCAQVVAITFTEKAAGEMKVRLRSAVSELLGSGECTVEERERLNVALLEIERAPISTIHAFAAGILREHPFEAGVDPGFEQLDALEGGLFLERCWNEFLAGLSAPYDLVLKRYLASGGDLERKLRDSIMQTVYGRRGDRSVKGLFARGRRTHAGGAAEPAFPAPFDISRLKADCTEMIRRLGGLAERHCREPGDRGYAEIMRFLDDVGTLEDLEGDPLEDLLLTVRMPRSYGRKENWDPPETCAGQKDLCKKLGEFQTSVRTELADWLRDGLEMWLDGFVRFVDGRKAEEGVLDFDDLLIRTRWLLGTEGARSALRRRYRYILVDEFQDTDPLQAEIVYLLAGEGDGSAGSLVPGKLFIVGDPKQSIYRFRNADVEIYEDVKERIAETGEHLAITQNFRSVPPLLDWVNGSFSEIMNPPERMRFQPVYEPIHPMRTGEAAAVVRLDLELESAASKADEVRALEGMAVARCIHRLIEGGYEIEDRVDGRFRPVRNKDIAVLYPGTTGIDYYEEPLRTEGIPYIVEGGRLYYARQEVRDLAAAIWSIEDPWDSLSLVAVLRSPLFGFSDEEIFLFVRAGGCLNYLEADLPDGERFEDLRAAFRLLAGLHERRDEAGPADTVTALLRGTKYLELSILRPHGEQRVQNIRKVVRDARLFGGRLHSFRRFALWFRDRDVSGSATGESPLVDEDEDAVRLLTIHKAKGLQFPVVILANLVQRRYTGESVLLEPGERLAFRLARGWETGNFASLSEIDKHKKEAEVARLLYVAATRAGDLLVVPGAPGRNSYYELVEPYLAGVMTWPLSELPALRGIRTPFVAMPGFTADGRKRSRAAREQWLTARNALLAGCSAGVEIVTPSGAEVSPGSGHPDEGGSSHGAAGGPPARSVSSPAADSAALFGSAFHRVMEIIDLGGAAGCKEIAAAAAAECGLEGAADELAALVAKALSSGIVRRASLATRCFREVPFTIALPAGTAGRRSERPGGRRFFEGRIDLLFEENGTWTAVDFKTDDVSGAAVDERFMLYRGQGALYAEALERFGIDLDGGVVFHFVRPGETRTLRMNDDTIAYARSLLGQRDP